MRKFLLSDAAPYVNVRIKGGGSAAVKEVRAGLECNGVPIYAHGVPSTIEVTIQPDARDDQSIKWPSRDRAQANDRTSLWVEALSRMRPQFDVIAIEPEVARGVGG